MIAPRVLNGRQDPGPLSAIYIGRPSKWGNRHTVGWCGRCRCNHTRKQAIALYERDLDANPGLLAALPDLKGRDLVCWCSPKSCHGDVLLRRANR